MTPKRCLPPILVLLLAAALTGAAEDPRPPTGDPPANPTPVDFNRSIRPILFSRCVSCHGPDAAAREAGLRLDTEAGSRADLGDGIRAIVPGDPAASELIARITEPHPDDRMPPAEKGDPLSDDEVRLLSRWIEEGARYDRHWAFIPPRDEAPPRRPDGTAAPTAIDAFIEARARSAGVPLTPRADRRTLVRRLHLDLLGLPPEPATVDAFLAADANDATGAWERLVDATLESPHFGERWAAMWLDLARYADTKGYEADRGRTMWPWRDLLIRRLNEDQPLDAFTREQLAGDLLPATGEVDRDRDRVLASAFHRNTMTNDEGGTDDEEFRVAAVLDRTDTTMLVWMGLTAGCAQCHSHKFDPISHREYYALAAFFDQTEDADRMDDAPTLAVASAADRAALSTARSELEGARRARDTALATFSSDEPAEERAPTPRETVALDPIAADGWTPPGAALRVDGRAAPWPWTAPTDPDTAAGRVVPVRAGAGQVAQVFFDRSYLRRDVAATDRIVTEVWLDPEAPPTTVMVQVHAEVGDWQHRAVWGEDAIEFGPRGTPARNHRGALPETGRWVRLAVPIAALGIAPGNRITGIAMTVRGGRAEWAGVWHETPLPADLRFTRSFPRFLAAMRADPAAPLPEELRALVAKDGPSAEELARLRTHFVTQVHPEGRARFATLETQIDDAERALAEREGRLPRVPVMRELPPDRRRTTHVLALGNFLLEEEPVEPAVPAAFHPWPAETPRNRLGLAAWLVSPDNPLTARVQVNRVWERLFGRGLVETVEDLGTQGMLPTHPALLDHLALRYIEDGWRLKPLLRRIVMSETYRRGAESTEVQRRLDPRNELLARSPRFRLPAEVVRDQALAIGGILSERMYGPPVFPPQPPGVWQVVYNGADWRESEGEDRRRRSLYTYWRRTSPFPSALTFDAPSREVCTARRIRSSTPLQALVTLNDPGYVEAAAGLAARMLGARAPGEPFTSALATGFRRATARPPRPDEHAVLARLLDDERAAFAADPGAARALLAEARWAADAEASPAELADRAALVVVAQVLLNLDEVLVRP